MFYVFLLNILSFCKVNEDTHEENMLEEKSANAAIDSWLMKSTDGRIDPVDAVRTGFKTLQVCLKYKIPRYLFFKLIIFLFGLT